MSGELVYDPKAGLGPMDRQLLAGAASRRSPVELAEEQRNRITPEYAANRVLEILDSRDWLTQAQMRMLLVDDMMQVKDKLMEMTLKFGDKDGYAPLIRILTVLQKDMAADKFDIAKAMNEISRAHAQILLSGISLALERTHLELETRYPQISKVELMEIFNASLPDVVKHIEGKVEQ